MKLVDAIASKYGIAIDIFENSFEITKLPRTKEEARCLNRFWSSLFINGIFNCEIKKCNFIYKENGHILRPTRLERLVDFFSVKLFMSRNRERQLGKEYISDCVIKSTKGSTLDFRSKSREDYVRLKGINTNAVKTLNGLPGPYPYIVLIPFVCVRKIIFEE